jgi:NADPH:quinone reductase-like Zn-dependent oxidoreductase
MAIQLAKHAGATVAVTAGSKEKLEACRELGADILINYKDEDFVAALKEATNGHGADVILDIVGAAYLARNVDALAADGRLAIIGMQGGVKAELNIGMLMTKRCSVLATTLRARPPAQKAKIVAAVREHVWPLVESGVVRPVVYRRLPIAEAPEAHRIMAASSHTGKILLTIK